jgi:hypothetical protein
VPPTPYIIQHRDYKSYDPFEVSSLAYSTINALTTTSANAPENEHIAKNIVAVYSESKCLKLTIKRDAHYNIPQIMKYVLLLMYF